MHGTGSFYPFRVNPRSTSARGRTGNTTRALSEAPCPAKYAPPLLPQNQSRYNFARNHQAESWKLQLNINNLFDEVYYNKAMFLGGMPGEERNAKLTFSYQI